MSIPTLFIFDLDQSASMFPVKAVTIEEYNNLVNEQAEVEGEAFITLTVFNHLVHTRYTGASIKDVPPLGSFGNEYEPDGSTALLDAVGMSIKSAEEWINGTGFDGQVKVVVLTDGEENMSHKWHLRQPMPVNDPLDVGALLKWKQEVDGWEFLFLGSGKSNWLEKSFGHVMTADSFAGFAVHDVNATRQTYAGVSRSLTQSRTTGARFDNSALQSDPDQQQ
jgi:hypothetical protein